MTAWNAMVDWGRLHLRRAGAWIELDEQESEELGYLQDPGVDDSNKAELRRTFQKQVAYLSGIVGRPVEICPTHPETGGWLADVIDRTGEPG